MPNIDIKRLQDIIRDELSVIREGDEHKTGAKVMTAAANLMTAIEAFKSSASEKAKASVDTTLTELEKSLKLVIDSPMQYVDTVKAPQFKKVTFKSVKTTG